MFKTIQLFKNNRGTGKVNTWADKKQKHYNNETFYASCVGEQKENIEALTPSKLYKTRTPPSSLKMKTTKRVKERSRERLCRL